MHRCVMRVWVCMYAGCGFIRGSTALCLYCLRRKATCANMWPDLAADDEASRMDGGPSRVFHQRRFFCGGGRGWFYCPRTRASCWNSKRLFRRDITPNVRVDPPGSIKGGGRSDDGGGLMISLRAYSRDTIVIRCCVR